MRKTASPQNRLGKSLVGSEIPMNFDLRSVQLYTSWPFHNRDEPVSGLRCNRPFGLPLAYTFIVRFWTSTLNCHNRLGNKLLRVLCLSKDTKCQANLRFDILLPILFLNGDVYTVIKQFPYKFMRGETQNS